jgi:putative sterol carrier protein
MEVKTPKEFFEKVLPSRFDPNKVAGFEALIQMNITGANGGGWIVKVRDKEIDIKEGVDPFPTISVTMADTDFVDMVNGKLGAVKAFMTGRLQFKGSISVGMRLMDIGFM